MEPYYQDAWVTLYLGNSHEVLPLLPFLPVDMILTDPPYGMGRFATDGKDYLTVVGPILRAAWDLLTDSGSMFVFTSTAEVVNVANAIAQPLKRLLWMYKPADCTYPLAGWLLKSEAILWFVKGKTLNLTDRRPYRHDCYIHTRSGQEGVEGHPTVKPLSVVTDLASRCPIAGRILDPFVGSGTTLLAAKNLGRRAIGIELEERYCEIAARRLQQEVFAFDSLSSPLLEQKTLDFGANHGRSATKSGNGAVTTWARTSPRGESPGEMSQRGAVRRRGMSGCGEDSPPDFSAKRDSTATGR